MWTFITQLLVTLVLLGFFLVSCQNVMHIVKGSLCFVLKHIHQELDKELGEGEGLSDDEETVSTRVVRRRVFLKVTTRLGQQRPGGGDTVMLCVDWGRERAPPARSCVLTKDQEAFKGQTWHWVPACAWSPQCPVWCIAEKAQL